MILSVIVKHMALRTGIMFLVKLIGFFARISLFRLLGSEGIGLYQMAYSVYGLILMVISGGFPTALALTTANSKALGWLLFKRFTILLLLFGGFFGFYSYILSPRIALLLGDKQLEFAIRSITPAIAIVPFLSLLRGYLQGIEYHGAIAVSELIEQIGRVVIMITLVTVWLEQGLAYAVGGAVLGPFAGALLALVFLLGVLATSPLPPKNPVSRHYQPKPSSDPVMLLFLNTSLSISATRLLMPISDFLEALIIPNRLQASGLSVSEATSIFGEISGIAPTVIYMPSLVTSALSFTLATKLTSDWELGRNGQFHRRSQLALEIGYLWGIGSVLFLFLYASELSILMFSTDSLASAIRFMCLALLFDGLRDISTVVLWAAGYKNEPLIGQIIGIIGSTSFIFFLQAFLVSDMQGRQSG